MASNFPTSNRSGGTTYSASPSDPHAQPKFNPDNINGEERRAGGYTGTGYGTVHDATTVGGPGPGTANEQGYYAHGRTGGVGGTGNSNSNNDSARSTFPSSQHPAKDVMEPINPATESNPLNSHHRPSVQSDSNQGLVGETTIRRASLSQNAPGRAGSIGEAALGGLGYGGSSVERPKEDQGVGEKIANFLGA